MIKGGEFLMKWWMKNDMRMIQNNIRDIDDRDMDIDREIAWLESMHANCLQIGCGGITAHHITHLDCQKQNPFMHGDFLGEVVEKCHQHGIKVIARFDFSKTHDSYLEEHPDWYSRTKDGEVVRYHDTVATCVNGEYQRRLSLDIIKEVITNYPVDGIFFNMFGYITKDYSGNYFGICRCENCKRLFKQMYGYELPQREDISDPAYQAYVEFKRVTVHDLLKSVYDMVKGINDDIAISTYALDYVDIVRNESNSAVDRPLPHWVYDSPDNVAMIEDSFPDKIVSNCAINAVDIPYRFMGVSDVFNRLRLYGNLAAGSGLDWCIIGNFDDYPDRSNFDGVKEVFAFHERHAQYFGHFVTKRKVLIVTNGYRFIEDDNAEFRGIYKMLKEAHVQFSEIMVEALPCHLDELAQYECIILPGIRHLPRQVVEVLESFPGCLISTGSSLRGEEESLSRLFGVCLKERESSVRGTYLKMAPDSVFPDFARRGQRWIYLDLPYDHMTIDGDAQGWMPLVASSMYGPPERCFGHVETEEPMASMWHKHIYLPWSLGALYMKQGYEEMKRVLFDLLDVVQPIPKEYDTNAPEMVEIFLDQTQEGYYLLQLRNLTGFNGSTFFKPLHLKDLYVRFTNIKATAVFEMTTKGLLQVPCQQNGVLFDLDDVYKAFLIKVKGEEDK